MAAGIINTSDIQLQFLLNQSLSSTKFKSSTRMIDISPQGKIRNIEGFEVGRIGFGLILTRKVEN